MTTRRRTSGFLLAGLLVALVVAGIGSYYASSSPDGLEWSAEKEGFAHTAEDSSTAGSPLADYAVSGVEDGRLSGGLAGVIGVAVTLALAGGITLLVRRRSGTDDVPADDDSRTDVDAGSAPKA
ncbi:PDGLE domain-containing protein [Blastococcus sp. TML/M2B]|uniref:PDGLE domain-containing protein n=1 Tax=unclassified Blastococcus TaxID=2619396 RepID=UPI001909C91C|nr:MULTISPECIES: PDGLE domain-containing protein [unclassified Blastococcus]MBN1093560.1 PDGLE domain-containing protein [Blastococcus sp. TML/M2B]MBN1096323.1 PDGLE domain-containing protein [Blastococcus sp. TML/C7B]